MWVWTTPTHGICADCKYPVVALITELLDERRPSSRTEKSDLGGTMRLGAQQCQLSDERWTRNVGPDIV